MFSPSALTATLVTAPVCPLYVIASRPAAVSQTRTVPSAPPETTCRPSGLSATA
jgi:hypothetical protein